MAISRKARIGLIAFVLLASTPIGALTWNWNSSRWSYRRTQVSGWSARRQP